MKKIIPIVIAIASVVLFSGCSNDQNRAENFRRWEYCALLDKNIGPLDQIELERKLRAEGFTRIVFRVAAKETFITCEISGVMVFATRLLPPLSTTTPTTPAVTYPKEDNQ